jgi:cytochrome P450
MLAELFSDVRLWTLLAILAGIQLFRPRKMAFPVFNKYPGDFLNRRAYRDSRTNCRQLITDGLAKHQGPITIAFPHTQKIVLPASLAGWVKANKDLDHRQLVRDEYFAGLPGFEAQTVLHGDEETPNRIIKTKLGQNESTVAAMNASLARGLQLIWGGSPDWHAINWHQDTTGIIARVASSVFVGPEMCDDAEWLELIQGYVMSYFTVVAEMHAYPRWMRPIVHWFLPHASNCRHIVTRVRAIMNQVVGKRQQEATRARQEGRPAPEYNDAIAWAQAASGQVDMGDLQLSLAMAALLTTSEMFRAVLVDLARQPELIEPLRKEVVEQISIHGVSIAAVNNMVLLDSFMKESQRLSSPLGMYQEAHMMQHPHPFFLQHEFRMTDLSVLFPVCIVVLERLALRDTALPDGRIVPRGAVIMVDSTDLWNAAVFPEPERFDGYRFLKRREMGDKATSQFVQSGGDYNVFGGGRHVCPGRFFASNELKLTLSHILLKYDLRLAAGCDPKPLINNYYAMIDPSVQLEVRRRTEDGARAGAGAGAEMLLPIKATQNSIV